jgi:tripartite-type tricarboxylate transporter receptor subunit TctC
VAGHIDLGFGTLTTHFPQVRAGSYKLYAVAGETRSALVPDTPTFAQMGLPALTYQNCYGLFASWGTPKDIISKLSLASVEALADPAARSRLAELGYEAFPREGRHQKRSAPYKKPMLRNGGRSSRSLGSSAAPRLSRERYSRGDHR